MFTLRLLTLAAIVVRWEVVAARGIVDPFFISRPSAILARLLQWTRDGSILGDTAVTLAEAGLGFAIAAVLGSPAAWCWPATPCWTR